jgi:hypothetical protein
MKPSESLDGLIQDIDVELLFRIKRDVFIFIPMYFIELLIEEFTGEFDSNMELTDVRIKNLHYRGFKILLNPINELTICSLEYSLNSKKELKHTVKL